MIDAIYKLYPQVVRTLGNVAYDANDNEVTYDKAAVKAKAVELQAEEIAKQQTAEAVKQSGMAKLAAIGLTPDEIKSLLGV
jgi:hypothetical protein